MFNPKLKNTQNDKLFSAVLGLKTVEECYNFFDDLCTVPEILSLSQRYAVACLLSEGKTYGEITESTGASAATISRISKCLSYGADGYKTAIEREKEGKMTGKD